MKKFELWHGDCLELMNNIPDGSVDLVLCDLPYKETGNKWDKSFPLEKVCKEFERIIKEDGAIVLTGTFRFGVHLFNLMPHLYKYDWVWDKHLPRNFLNSKIMPMQQHENIMVFNCKGTKFYHPQMIKRDKPISGYNAAKKGKDSPYKLNQNGTIEKENKCYDYKYPTTIITGKWIANKGKVHPSQKPVDLLEYLIKTYSNEGELILDFTMGSGSTGVACMNTNRKFIGIELDEKYFDISINRIFENYN